MFLSFCGQICSSMELVEKPESYKKWPGWGSLPSRGSRAKSLGRAIGFEAVHSAG